MPFLRKVSMQPVTAACAFLSLYLTMKRKMFHADSVRVVCRFCICRAFVSLSFFSNYNRKHDFMKYSVLIVPQLVTHEIRSKGETVFLEVLYLSTHHFIVHTLPFLPPLTSFPARVVVCTSQLLQLIPFFTASGLCTFCSLILEQSSPAQGRGGFLMATTVIPQAPLQITCLQRSFSRQLI